MRVIKKSVLSAVVLMAVSGFSSQVHAATQKKAPNYTGSYSGMTTLVSSEGINFVGEQWEPTGYLNSFSVKDTGKKLKIIWGVVGDKATRLKNGFRYSSFSEVGGSLDPATCSAKMEATLTKIKAKKAYVVQVVTIRCGDTELGKATFKGQVDRSGLPF